MKLLIDEMWPATLAEEIRRRGQLDLLAVDRDVRPVRPGDVVAVLEQPDLAHHGDTVVFDHTGKEGRVVPGSPVGCKSLPDRDNWARRRWGAAVRRYAHVMPSDADRGRAVLDAALGGRRDRANGTGQ